jgi:D-aminoacyl-tRNA deacylase
MRAVVQRVSSAEVRVAGDIKGSISKGLLILLGISDRDNDETISWMANKLVNLRIFPDENDKMNISVKDINGGILIVSNFTVYGDVERGFRPSFSNAGKPADSEIIYNKFMKKHYSIQVETGIFGAMMDVSLVNDGPVTLIIDKD